ncbi:hypothetical protein [Mycolicibacterium gilvum]|uniref:hypothetical protein n=1 Tax=Mycolicibacterium gilvum TaxID=1804 RepID=UPI000C1B40A6
MTHHDDLDGHDLIDDSRAVHLFDQGSLSRAVVAIDATGTERLILADPQEINTAAEYHAGCLDAPHEQTGPLPSEIWSRIWARPTTPIFCGRRNRHGQPCRSVVDHHGQACRYHLGVPSMTAKSTRSTRG